MCGICGLSSSSKISFTESNLSKILDRISHRGPDDKGYYIDNNTVLFHTRLSIQDTSSLGHQPMFSTDKKIAIVYNGEIYNFREIRDELKKKGIKFFGNSDTEVLVNLYKEEGLDMLPKLNGIFSFALWDQDSQNLFLARDNFGVKPLFYSVSKNNFYFASELKGLISLLEKKILCNFDTFPKYLSYLYCPGKETPMKSVYKILPGEAMIVSNGEIKKNWKWYHPPFSIKKSKLNHNKQALIEGVRYQLNKAVSRQMIADVPVGAFLSGGLDSSSIVSFASRINSDIRCFTIEVQGDKEEGTTDDLLYANKVAKFLDVSLEVVKINSSKMASDIEQMVKILDEPIADPAALNVLYISRLAKKQGIKVLLSGVGGDDIFTGYRRHTAIANEYIWSWLPIKIRTKLKSFSAKLNQNFSINRKITKLFSGAHLEGNDRLINYFNWIQREDLLKLYSKEFGQEIKNSNPYSEMINFLQELPSNGSMLERCLALEQRFFLADHNLLYTDRMSMATGVEVRVPFLDKELVEYVHDIPDRYKQNGNVGKWILKEALKGYLPLDVIYRPKTGFGAPLRRWIRFELRELLCDVLSFESIKNRGIFDPNAVLKLISDNNKGKIDASYTLLSILCIELWIRNYIKN